MDKSVMGIILARKVPPLSYSFHITWLFLGQIIGLVDSILKERGRGFKLHT